MKIAVIGAGMGGCSCARFIREAFPNCSIDVLERTDRVGGRTSTVQVEAGEHETKTSKDGGGDWYESGASVIHSSNQYLVNFSQEFGMKQVQPPAGRLGLFDGNALVLETSHYQLISLERMLWRYGLAPFRLSRWVNKFVAKFGAVYTKQQQEFAWTSPAALVAALDKRFAAMLVTSLEDQLKRDGFPDRFVQELPQGVVRVNYGQTTKVPAFVGAVALAGTGGALWAVQGGNYTLAEKILESAKSHVRFNAAVKKISRDAASGKYSIHAHATIEGTPIDLPQYDMVFICAPLDKSRPEQLLQFENLGPKSKAPQHLARSYHQTVASFFRGSINPKAIGNKDVPEVLLTTKENVFFNSIGLYDPVDGHSASRMVHKVFSNEILTKDQRDFLFPSPTATAVRAWQAYPEYSTESHWANEMTFCVDDEFLFYCNAMEVTASAMEVAVIGAKNCVLLAQNKLNKRMDRIDPFPASNL